jgi:predicted alpha/beta-hydrolase family hydrolase
MPEAIRVELAPTRHVTALLYEAAAVRRTGITLILAPGAGAGQRSPFMTRFAAALAARGIDVVTFDFPYREEGRRIPDANATLEACWRAAIDRVRSRPAAAKLAIGGKSMGGRIASQVAALGDAGALLGLVLLGYPLHPPGKPEQLRTRHFSRLSVPSLFVQGTRDAFGTPEELSAALSGTDVPATLYPIADGDHSFKVPKRGGRTADMVEAEAQDRIRDWLVQRATATS